MVPPKRLARQAPIDRKCVCHENPGAGGFKDTVYHMGTIKEDLAVGADWIARALQSSGYRADFAPESLWEIDRFFDEHSRDGAAKPWGLLAEDLGKRMFALGAYVGEVVRRQRGGEWRGDDADPEAELTVELHLPDGTSVWPVQRVMKRLQNGPEDGIAAWGHTLNLPVGPRPEPPKSFWKRLLGR
jgi:hypothetical protein